jgi:hypothetical protein
MIGPNDRRRFDPHRVCTDDPCKGRVSWVTAVANRSAGLPLIPEKSALSRTRARDRPSSLSTGSIARDDWTRNRGRLMSKPSGLFSFCHRDTSIAGVSVASKSTSPSISLGNSTSIANVPWPHESDTTWNEPPSR